MQIEFDPAKDTINQAKHGLSLSLAELFELDIAIIEQDTRYDYQEVRMVALGPIGDFLYVLAYTWRGTILRAISLRKANRKEALRYDEQA
jgi:uncharacterized DUF497 family protein